MVEYEQEIRIIENIVPRPLSSRRRTGRAFYIDTFEDYYDVIEERWTDNLGTVELSTDFFGVSGHLQTGTALNARAMLGMAYGEPPAGRWGVEFDFLLMENIVNVVYIKLWINYYDGTNIWKAAVTYLGEANKKWQYTNASNTETDIADGDYELWTHTTNPVPHNVKLVIDTSNNEYVALYVDGRTLSLADLGLYNSGSAAGIRRIEIYIEVKNATATYTRDLYVKNVILTDQEPE